MRARKLPSCMQYAKQDIDSCFYLCSRDLNIRSIFYFPLLGISFLFQYLLSCFTNEQVIFTLWLLFCLCVLSSLDSSIIGTKNGLQFELCAHYSECYVTLKFKIEIKKSLGACHCFQFLWGTENKSTTFTYQVTCVSC